MTHSQTFFWYWFPSDLSFFSSCLYLSSFYLQGKEWWSWPRLYLENGIAEWFSLTFFKKSLWPHIALCVLEVPSIYDSFLPAPILALFFFSWPCCMACGFLVPNNGSNPRPLHLKCGVLTTGLPGRSLSFPSLSSETACCFVLHASMPVCLLYIKLASHHFLPMQIFPFEMISNKFPRKLFRISCYFSK